MVKERFEHLTRAKVIQLGLIILSLGAVGFGAFRFIGFDGTSSGIWTQALLFVIILGWTGSYLLRVITGKMTFMEQRKRYLQSYEELTNTELQQKYDAMSEKEKTLLMEEIERENNPSSAPTNEA